MLDLQRSAGNAAVSALIQRSAEIGELGQLPPLQRSSAPVVQRGFWKNLLERIRKPKLGMNKESGQLILQKVFGGIRTITPGKVEVLEPDKFKEAYDKIYGATAYSWDAYVVPTYGGLNGFAYEGVNYINKASAGLHTVVHEMLHNNTADDWRGVVGSRWDEGTTEVLTQDACAKFKVDAPTTYPGESPVVREALAQGLPKSDLEHAYLKGGAQAKIADWADKNCVSNWATIKGHMEANQWAAAKAALQKK